SVCTLGLRLSCYPDMPIETAKARIEACIRRVERELAQPDTQVRIRYEGFHAPGCEYDLDVPPLRLLAEAHQRVTGEAPRSVALTGTTDGRHFRLMMDVPVTCYGPVSRNYHGFTESVSVHSMLRVAKTYALFLNDRCGVQPRLGCARHTSEIVEGVIMQLVNQARRAIVKCALAAAAATATFANLPAQAAETPQY